MDERFGYVGIICTPNHQETLEGWSSEIALTCQTLADENIELSAALKQMDQLAAEVVVIDEDAVATGTCERALRNFRPAHKDATFIFIANSQRYKEAALVQLVAKMEQFAVILPRFYAGKKDDCKRLFVELAHSKPSPAKNEELLRKYDAQPTKGFFHKPVVVPCEDVLFNEVKSKYDIPESEKQSQVEYFREKQAPVEEVKKEEILENSQNEVDVQAQINVPVTSQENEHHVDAVELELTPEDEEFERMMKQAKADVPPITVEDVKEEISIAAAEMPQIDEAMIDEKINAAFEKAFAKWESNALAALQKAIAMSKEPQKTIYVSEIVERSGAVRFASNLAFAYAHYHPDLKVGLYFNNDEGSEALSAMNLGDETKDTVVYKGAHVSKIDSLNDSMMSNYNVKIVCLPDVGKLEELQQVYDEMYVLASGEPWDVQYLAVPLSHYVEMGLSANTVFVPGPTYSAEVKELVTELTKGSKNVSWWNRVDLEPNFFKKNSRPKHQWEEIISFEGEEPKVKALEKPKEPVKEKKELPSKKPVNVFAEYMAWTKEDWKKPENETVFKWLLGYSGPDGFSLGKEHANGKTHPEDYHVMRNKLFQWFPEDKKAVIEFLEQKKHQDDAQK